MQATVSIIHDPFHPARGRELRAVLSPVSLGELAPATSRPFICLRNGEPVLRREWTQQVQDADVIAFVTLPQGGGGGSNPMRLLLMIAVVALQPWAVGAVSSAFNVALSSTAASLVGAGFVAGGMMLVNALIPPPKPPSFASAASLAAPSPTYSLQAQGNYARLDAAIPVQYGRVKAYPDFASQPYAEYSGNEQYLYQLLVVGQGEYEIESINIEDTPITSFDEITT
nr:MoaD/ThiS family protein [Burkholderiaceae bacterium]